MPREYENSARDYFASVADNVALDPALRVKAGVEIGTFAAYSGALDRQRISRLSAAAEAAIENYRRHLVATST
jgi:hypothetical protein